MEGFKGKAIYQPKGKAAEYAKWACNFYVGCSNGCTYCYCKKGVLATHMGSDKPILKKCFRDEEDALNIFSKELYSNLHELQKHGLFFSFTTDPMLKETAALTMGAVFLCVNNFIPVKILTKSTTYIEQFLCSIIDIDWSYISFGFTLTGHDELEPGASTNEERIQAMKKLHDAGFKTFGSIEPIIDFESSFQMIQETQGFCDLYKIGIMSGSKYSRYDVLNFVGSVYTTVGNNSKIYFKDSLLKLAYIDRKHELPENCVGRDYNIFKN